MTGQATGQIGNSFDAEIARRNLTNQQVAWALGVSEKTVVRWRKGLVVPKTRQLQKVLAWVNDEDWVAERAA